MGLLNNLKQFKFFYIIYRETLCDLLTYKIGRIVLRLANQSNSLIMIQNFRAFAEINHLIKVRIITLYFIPKYVISI